MPKSLKRQPPKKQPRRRSVKHRANPDLARANKNNPKSLIKGSKNLGTRKAGSPQRAAGSSDTLKNGIGNFAQLIAYGFNYLRTDGLNYLKTLKPNFKINRDVLYSRQTKIVGIIIIAIILLFIAASALSSLDTETEIETTHLGNNSLGSVEKIGPYGNANSPVKIAYILGVHPREKGSHEKFEKALLNKSSNLSYCYYIYKINVTKDSTDYDQSRINGQKLAREFAVPNIVNETYNLTVDVHYSNGAWGVASFVFTPNESDNVSYTLCQNLVKHFTWLSYYTTEEATSPEYVTGPIENGGVPAIVYEAYTEDSDNTTIEHAKEVIDYIDNWDFENLKVKDSNNNTSIFGFSF